MHQRHSAAQSTLKPPRRLLPHMLFMLLLKRRDVASYLNKRQWRRRGISCTCDAVICSSSITQQIFNYYGFFTTTTAYLRVLTRVLASEQL